MELKSPNSEESVWWNFDLWPSAIDNTHVVYVCDCFMFIVLCCVACISCKVETGRLLKKWRAHFRAVSCLVFSEDDSLLVSGSEDGSVRVWSLFMY